MTAMIDLFDDGSYYTGPPLDGDMLRRAEEALGVRLPRGYVDVLSYRNGGTLRRQCYATMFPTSWAPDHIGVRALLGLGGERGTDKMSVYWISEWDYPQIGVVLCDLPSGGHDTVMLDYSECGPDGEPSVVYVDEDRIPRRIADTFDDFIAGLVSCERFDTQGG
jgi:SMI1-KNR4 cell-wall